MQLWNKFPTFRISPSLSSGRGLAALYSFTGGLQVRVSPLFHIIKIIIIIIGSSETARSGNLVSGFGVDFLNSMWTDLSLGRISGSVGDGGKPQQVRSVLISQVSVWLFEERSVTWSSNLCVGAYFEKETKMQCLAWPWLSRHRWPRISGDDRDQFRSLEPRFFPSNCFLCIFPCNNR